MKFIISKSSLSSALSQVKGAIGTRAVIPILENVLLNVQEGTLYLTATNLENTITVKADIETKEKGKVTVPFTIFSDIINASPDCPLVIEADLQTNTVQLITDAGKYKIAGESAEEYPKLPKIEDGVEFSVSAEILKDALATVLPFAGNDELRPQMSGVCMAVGKGSVDFIATDGNALALQSVNAELGIERQFLIPKQAAYILKNSLADGATKVLADEKNIQFINGSFCLNSRLVDAKFVDYKSVFPQDQSNPAIIENSLLTSALKRASVFTNKTSHASRFLFNGSLTITAQDLDFSNEAIESLKCEFTGSQLEIGLNTKFMQTALSVLKGREVKMDLYDYNRPILLSNNGSGEVKILLMPIVLTQ